MENPLIGKKNTSRIWQDTAPVFGMIRGPKISISILIHVNPDGDAIGSALALSGILKKMDHECHIISPNAFPEFLKWMPGSDEIVVFNEDPHAAKDLITHSELIIALDFNTLSRVSQFNNIVTLADAYVLMIDHHPDPDPFADCILSDTAMSSTAEIVYQFFIEGGLISLLDKDGAACLFTGIVTDTGCFSYNSSRKETFEIIGALLDYGIDKDRIYALLYDNFSSGRMRLLGYGLNEKMVILWDYNTAYIWLTKKELTEYHYQVGDSEGFVNYPLSIQGIRFTAFFIERDDHVKISFRSKGKFETNRFAKQFFNGGGHMNASGGESYASMEETLEIFIDGLKQYKDKLIEDED